MTMGVRALLLAAFGLFAIAGSALAQTAAEPKTLVDVGGHKLNVRVSGTANPGVPTVVFESGLGSSIDAWFSVPSEIAAMTRVVAYERPRASAPPSPVRNLASSSSPMNNVR